MFRDTKNQEVCLGTLISGHGRDGDDFTEWRRLIMCTKNKINTDA